MKRNECRRRRASSNAGASRPTWSCRTGSIWPRWRTRWSKALVAALGLLLVATGVGQITGVGRISDVAPYVLSAEAKGAPKTFKDCAKHCPEMVVVPAGEFTMGSLEGREHGHKRETPQHKVTIAHPFAVSRFEVTFKQWDACAAARGCKNRPSDSGWGRGTRPVINVGWDDAKEYVAWLSNSTHKPYRLLSEAEWEYAARAGTTTNFSFESDKALGEHAWYDDNSKKMTHPVGQKKPNSFGLYDMHGNVWEWVEDSWHDSYEGAPSDGTAWRQQGDPSLGVLRGGSWSSSGYFLRSANRFQSTGEEDEIGFRVARTLGP